MKKKNKKLLNFIIFFIFILFNCSYTLANVDIYFLSLKNNKVNLRQGPSLDYPIKLIYKKKYLPIIITEKSGTWRKIIDFKNNSGWIHVSQLSKKKAGITVDDNLLVFKNPTLYSKPLVILKKGRLCLIKKCKDMWCKISVDKYTGWIKKDSLWGRL